MADENLNPNTQAKGNQETPEQPTDNKETKETQESTEQAFPEQLKGNQEATEQASSEQEIDNEGVDKTSKTSAAYKQGRNNGRA